jgi:predicted Zn-ribbon and HTH transcriptional regulator
MRKYSSPTYLLTYECPECGHQFRSNWSAVASDTCPQCQREDVEPKTAEKIA